MNFKINRKFQGQLVATIAGITLALLVFACALEVKVPAALAGGRRCIELVQTGQAAELVPNLLVTGTGQPYQRSTIFRATLRNVKAGDIAAINSYAELTNDLRYLVMLGWLTELVFPDGQRIEATEAHGYNITPDIHHGPFIDTGFYQFEKDSPTVDVETQIYSASTAAPTDGSAKITVERDYGRLAIIHHRTECNITLGEVLFQ